MVLPILDGHAECDKQFTTIENNALDIIEFVNSKLGGSVLMMGGLSLGGQILLEILSQRKDICKYAIVESVLVIPSKFTYSMIKPAFGSCYGLIKYKWFSKLQFKSLRIKFHVGTVVKDVQAAGNVKLQCRRHPRRFRLRLS